MSLEIDLGPEFKQESINQANTDKSIPQGPVVTLTTKLQHAHEVLKSRQAIKELFREFDMKPDEIQALQARVKTAADTYNEHAKETRLTTIHQQMSTLGLTIEELSAYVAKEKRNASTRKRTNKFIMAVVNGIEVYNIGPIPKEVQALGYRNRKGIPEEFLTTEWKLAKGLIGG